jgi:hypothetical protein
MGKGKMSGRDFQGHDPHSRVREPYAASKGGSEVGPERHGDVRGVQEGGSRAEAKGAVLHTSSGVVGETHLKHAVNELHRQHPHHHQAHMTNKETKEHDRHHPVGKVYR